MSLAPPAPKRRYLRKVSSPGRPSSVPSQPSIGWMQRRLPTRSGPTRTGRNRGLRSSLKRRSSPSSRDAAAKSSIDLNLKKRAKEDPESKDDRRSGGLSVVLYTCPVKVSGLSFSPLSRSRGEGE